VGEGALSDLHFTAWAHSVAVHKTAGRPSALTQPDASIRLTAHQVHRDSGCTSARLGPLARFRLRFLLHEMDLPLGELVIGRSASCGLTIDDPLVSRSHARLIVEADRVLIEDAGSRNGIRVNGRTISGRMEMGDGSRLRLGTQELMIRRLEESAIAPPRRPATGFMIHCSSCGLPFSTEAGECPHCGVEKDANSDEPTTTTEQAWSIELVAETIHRARALGRSDNLERLLVQARAVLDSVSVTVDRRRLDQLADGAIRYSAESGNVEWARWALSLYSKRGIAPGYEVGQQLVSLPPEALSTLVPAVNAVVSSIRPPALGEELADEATITLLRSFSEGPGALR